MKAENRFRKHLEDKMVGLWGQRVFIQKNHGSMYSVGLPDLYIYQREYREAHVELKCVANTRELDDDIAYTWQCSQKGDGHLTRLQLLTLQRLELSGANARVVIYFPDIRRVVGVRCGAAEMLISKQEKWPVGLLKADSYTSGVSIQQWPPPPNADAETVRTLIFR